MKKIRFLCVLLVAALLVCAGAFAAQADANEAYSLIDQAVSSNYSGEQFTVRTPEDEPCTLYVSGKAEIETKIFMISVKGAEGTYIQVFVYPDENGEFSVKINTTAGNSDFPTADKGRVVADETGGQTNVVCLSTMPGYSQVAEMPEGFYRVLITRGTTDLHVQGVYDRKGEDCDYYWYHESNPLSGNQGYAAREFPLYVMDNSPRLVYYDDIATNNATIRAADAVPETGSAAWTQYTDVYLKDIEWSMNTDGNNVPLQADQVAYLKSVADELSEGSESAYETALRFYRYLCENFYYDNYAFSIHTHAYCNPYDNLYALRNAVAGPNCINGKVATTCNGYASMMVALCRAEGIPARVVNGAQLTRNWETWNVTDKDYRNEVTHWWCEVYVTEGESGRWVVIDADRGSCNEWARENWDVADDATWKKGDRISYAGFDMSDFGMANSYCYQNVYASSTYQRELPAPVITDIDTSIGYVSISWEPVEGCDSYYIYRGTLPYMNKSSSDPVDGAVQYFASAKGDAAGYISVNKEKGIEEPGVTYYYRVAARKEGVTGTLSNMISACVSEEERAGALPPPEFDTQPADVTAEIGEMVSFSVAAHNGTLSYQWQYYSTDSDAWYDLSSSAFTGLDTDTMTVKATEARNGKQYRCKVSNEYFTRYSEAATLTVEARPPVITLQPVPVIAAEYENAVFTVSAEGTDLKYKWQYYDADSASWKTASGSSFSGTETPTLTVTVRTWHDGVLYRCRISNASGTVESDSAKLTLKPEISTQPKSVSAYTGDSATFTVKTKGSNLTYQWQYRKSASGSWISSKQEGSKTASMTVLATASRNGYEYRCWITGADITLYSDPATLTVLGNITAQPESKAAYLGDAATFTVKAKGSDLSYQWQYRKSASGSWLNSTQDGSKTASMAVSVTAARNGYQYRCKVSNNGVVTCSDAATLTALANITAQPESKTVYLGNTATFTVKAKGSGLSYKWQYRKSASGSWLNSTQEGSKTSSMAVSVTAARDGYQYRCKVTNNGVVTYSDAATLTARPLISYQPYNSWTILGETATFKLTAGGSAVKYQWQYRSSESGSWTNSYQDGYNTNKLSVKATEKRAGYQYRCKVSNNGVTAYSDVVELHVKKLITAQPKSASGAVGSTVKFTVTAAEGSALSYQWQVSTDGGATWKNTTLTGAKTATLSVKVTAARAGYQYRCKVTNNGETVISNAATLSVK
ncbi:MAG: hypothetical protein IK149_00875 [Oscillospiraceae bacterium]|nr:hypothetical protein [Oscillospiraceae bacterium]